MLIKCQKSIQLFAAICLLLESQATLAEGYRCLGYDFRGLNNIKIFPIENINKI